MPSLHSLHVLGLVYHIRGAPHPGHPHSHPSLGVESGCVGKQLQTRVESVLPADCGVGDPPYPEQLQHFPGRASVVGQGG